MASAADGHRYSKYGFAELHEGIERVLKALLNGARVLARLQSADGVVAADQLFVQREIDFAGI